MILLKKTACLMLPSLFAVTVAASGSYGQETTSAPKPEMPQVVLTPTPQPIPEYLAPAPQRKGEERTTVQTENKPLILRALEGTAVGAAIYNTQKQNDGRPQTPTSVYK